MRKTLSFAILLLASSLARAAVPSAFSVQGVLRDGAGKLQTMVVAVSVSLFDAQASGNKLAGPYGPTSVMATNGLFTMPIEDAALQAELASASQIWLEVTVGSDTFPRQPVEPQVFALMCGTADHLNGVLPLANGGTGSATQNFVDLTTTQSVAGLKTFTSDLRVSNGGSANQYQLGPFYNFDDFHITHSADGFATHSPYLTIAAASGYVGIGTANPARQLHLAGAAGVEIVMEVADGLADHRRWNFVVGGAPGAAQIFYIRQMNDAGTGGQVPFLIDGNGNIGIGNISPDATLSVNGTADKVGGGSWATFSDERLKNITGAFSAGLEAVMKLEPIRYEYKKDNALGLISNGEHIGFSAQAVQKVIPEAVTKNDKGYLLVNNDPIEWAMLNAIKQQQREIVELRARLERLERLAGRLADAPARRSHGARAGKGDPS